MFSVKMGFTCLIYFLMMAYIKPNLWDNLLTNYDAPEIQIETEKYVSFKDEISGKEIFQYAHSNNFNSIRIITSNIQSVDITENIYINLGEGNVYFKDKDGKCTIRNYPFLKTMTVKFLLINYDLVAYVKDPEKSQDLDYLITRTSLSAELITDIIDWIINNLPKPSSTRILDSANRGDSADDKADEAAIIKLYTDKSALTLKSLDIKFQTLFYKKLIPENLDLRNLDYFFFLPNCQKKPDNSEI